MVLNILTHHLNHYHCHHHVVGCHLEGLLVETVALIHCHCVDADYFDLQRFLVVLVDCVLQPFHHHVVAFVLGWQLLHGCLQLRRHFQFVSGLALVWINW
jgi:hypothetical protein